MRPIEARNDLGPCGGCGVNMDRGEWVVFYNVGTTHAGCIPRESANTLQTQTHSSGFLFDDPVQAEGERVKEKVGAVRIAVHGETYSERRDKARITKHLLAVFELLKDGELRSTVQIAEAVGCAETTASARCRQLKAVGHTVTKRWVKGRDGESGHFIYGLIVNQALMGKWEGRNESRAA